MTTPSSLLIDQHLDAVLRASGSALRYFTTQKTLDDMRAAMGAAMTAATPVAPAPQDAQGRPMFTSLMRDEGGETPAFCLMAAYRNQAAAEAAYDLIAATPKAGFWQSMDPWLSGFIGRGAALVKVLYNDPLKDVDCSMTGDWIQTANELFKKAHTSGAAPAHPDDAAVDAFAAAMRAKLASKRDQGRSGWNDQAQCTQNDLARGLRDHMHKGDPVDVGNFAMFLHARGESTTLPPGLRGDLTDEFAAMAAATEREACAQVCDEYALALDGGDNHYLRSGECRQAAARIRARGKQ